MRNRGFLVSTCVFLRQRGRVTSLTPAASTEEPLAQCASGSIVFLPLIVWQVTWPLVASNTTATTSATSFTPSNLPTGSKPSLAWDDSGPFLSR
jgi:hypothetical protein